MNHTYSKKFSGGFRCEFTLTYQGTEMNWSPDRPPQSWPHWGEYFQWRDWCCGDWAQRSGVWFLMQIDIPWLGVRGAEPIFRDDAAAYAYASAQRDCIVNAKRTVGPSGLRDSLLRGFENSMLKHAPRSAGGAA